MYRTLTREILCSKKVRRDKSTCEVCENTQTPKVDEIV